MKSAVTSVSSFALPIASQSASICFLCKELLDVGDEGGAFDQAGDGNGLHVVGEVRVVGFDHATVRPRENYMVLVSNHCSHCRPSSRVARTQMSRASPDIGSLARSASNINSSPNSR
ncbi:MAG: hypothetical protein OXI95_10655 [bacterium]|nr:hypothetical protein [bacterium]